MSKVSYILRTITLSLLFGGSVGIIFAAITLVKTAIAEKGITAAQAAAANAPIFFNYTPIALVSAVVLLLAIILEIAQKRPAGKITKSRWATSLLCVAATAAMAFAIIPPMKALSPKIASDEEAHAQFRKLHEASRGVYGAIILFALASLILPAFESEAKKQ